MIITEPYTVNGRAFVRTASDAGKYVVREGINYIEACDPAELGRTYTEGNPIPDDEYTVDAEQLLNIMIGGGT